MLIHCRVALLVLMMPWTIAMSSARASEPARPAGRAAPASTAAGVQTTAASPAAPAADRSPHAAAGTHSHAVWPTGWRRTTRGWERSEHWQLPPALSAMSAGARFASSESLLGRPQSINDWIRWDRHRELPWAQLGTRWVRSIHPLAIGLLLVGTALLITRFSERSHVAGTRAAASQTE